MSLLYRRLQHSIELRERYERLRSERLAREAEAAKDQAARDILQALAPRPGQGLPGWTPQVVNVTNHRADYVGLGEEVAEPLDEE